MRFRPLLTRYVKTGDGFWRTPCTIVWRRPYESTDNVGTRNGVSAHDL
ncbi:MAG TPA: hypothetical protein VHL11_05885 [Phototrophicaceae bacterium]|nr:hypothetical protein [Phototrophicaceae bacterium]